MNPNEGSGPPLVMPNDHSDLETRQEGEPMNVHPIQGKGPAATSPQPSRRPAGARGARKGPYFCTCGKKYAQLQGLHRHHKEKHEPSSCSYCDIFKWGRLYQYKEHLQKEHSDVV